MAEKSLKETTTWYQSILKSAGGSPDLVVDGRYGKSTSKALRRFQQLAGLETSGILDVKTNVGLNQVAMELLYQKRLPEPLGIMHTALRNQLKQFQRDYDLQPDGKVGALTREIMTKVLQGKLAFPLRNYNAYFGQGVPVRLDALEGALEGAEMPAPPTSVAGLVEDTRRAPFRWICSVSVFFRDPDNSSKLISFGVSRIAPDSQHQLGSGLLVGPCHVLTAAHVVKSWLWGSKGTLHLASAKAIEVTPGRNTGSKNPSPIGTFRVEKRRKRPYVKAPSAFKPAALAGRFLSPTPPNHRTQDFALIKLDTDVGNKEFRGKPYGWWKRQGRSTRILAQTKKELEDHLNLPGTLLHSSGYPVSAAGAQVQTKGGMLKIEEYDPLANHPDILPVALPAEGGFSGSPIWIEHGSRLRTLVGVMSQGVGQSDQYGGRALAIVMNKHVVDQVQAWKIQMETS